MAEQGPISTAVGQTLLWATTGKLLWRAIIIHVLKDEDNVLNIILNKDNNNTSKVSQQIVK